MTTRRRQDRELERHYRRQAEETVGAAWPCVTLRAAPRAHPWVFRRMLREPWPDLEPGTLVEARGRDGGFVGRGFFNPHSEIALRLLTVAPDEIPDAAWFRERVREAAELRREALRLPEQTDAFRLIHSEGDGISGLVVDHFAGVLVAEIFSAGVSRYFERIAAALEAEFPGSPILARADRRSEKLEGLKLDGPPAPAGVQRVVIREGRARFEVDLRRGHKTGFFLDQRENRTRMAEWCRGEELFDGFCYTGAFALRAVLEGAREVEAVDLDEDALEVARRNAELNGQAAVEKTRFRQGNVFEVLREHRAAGRQFGRMVLDPAKLAVARHEKAKALNAYADMNRLGLQCLRPGGLLLSCSCTGLVSEGEFLEALRVAADEAGRRLQILEVRGAAPDHPVSLHVPEGRYLKAVWSRVLERL